jgi:catechol 2,3-dioxygenase-like lactoylglutathione lyase family enzyme
VISELQVTTLSVSDLSRSVDFYGEAFGYQAGGVLAVGGTAVEQAWQAPLGTLGRCTVLGPSRSRTGLLRLVEFDTPGERIWGDYQRRQDYGHYALNIRVSNINDTLERIRGAGGLRRSGPDRWSPSPDIDAWDSLSLDPDGVMLDVFQIDAALGSPLASFDQECSEIQTVAMHVSDAPRSAEFYGALGYLTLYDKLIEGMETFFGLPAGVSMRNINLYVPSEPACGRVELAQYVGFPGRQQRDRATPPNLGILSVSLETDDLAATSAGLTARGAEPVCPPVDLDLPPYGSVTVQPFFGLDGEVLELFQQR